MPDTDTTLPVFIGGRYRLEDRLGTGGAGEVWSATDTVLGRRVAVKLLRDHLREEQRTAERFRREATAAASLTHPNVVTIYDIGAEGDVPHLVMELVDGPSLADAMAAGATDAGTAAAIAWQVADALGAAHGQGMVHRDVTPANILLSPLGVAKVADFGVAKALGGAAQTLTSDGAVVGTVAYLAPEQLSGDRIGPEADVYALGLVLWELLAGRRPFAAETPSEMFARRLAADVPPLPDDLKISPEVATIVRTATQRAPGRRYPDGGAMAAALGALVSEDHTDRIAALATRVGSRSAHEGTAVLDHTAALDALGPTRVVRPADAGETQILPAATTPGSPELPTVRGGVPTEDDRSGQRRPAWTWDSRSLAAAALAIALVAVLASFLAGPDDGDAPAAPAAASAAPAAPYAIVGGGDHDPFGDVEHPEDIPAAFDGDPATAWTTQRYASADLGGLKPGVGMWIDLGEPREVGAVVVELGIPGASFQIHAMDAVPGSDPAAWGPAVGEVSEAAATSEITLSTAATGRYVLLWFTSLPADGGRHRTTVTEVRVLPPA